MARVAFLAIRTRHLQVSRPGMYCFCYIFIHFMKIINCFLIFQAFSLFFSCLSLTSDILCSYAIKDDWIFFLASSYVWVQYVWHTERGVCFPTIFLWFLFVWVEAAVRLKDISKDMSHRVNLCRPFAAHRY